MKKTIASLFLLIAALPALAASPWGSLPWGGGGGGGGGGTAGVSTFNSRSGDVLPQLNDYSSYYALAGTGVTLFNSRAGNVVPQASDYSSFFAPINSGVTLFAGRSGNVTPQAGDYSAFYAPIGAAGAVSTVFGRSGAVVAQAGDYASFYDAAGAASAAVAALPLRARVVSQPDSDATIDTSGATEQFFVIGSADITATRAIILSTTSGEAGRSITIVRSSLTPSAFRIYVYVGQNVIYSFEPSAADSARFVSDGTGFTLVAHSPL